MSEKPPKLHVPKAERFKATPAFEETQKYKDFQEKEEANLQAPYASIEKQQEDIQRIENASSLAQDLPETETHESSFVSPEQMEQEYKEDIPSFKELEIAEGIEDDARALQEEDVPEHRMEGYQKNLDQRSEVLSGLVDEREKEKQEKKEEELGEMYVAGLANKENLLEAARLQSIDTYQPNRQEAFNNLRSKKSQNPVERYAENLSAEQEAKNEHYEAVRLKLALSDSQAKLSDSMQISALNHRLWEKKKEELKELPFFDRIIKTVEAGVFAEGYDARHGEADVRNKFLLNKIDNFKPNKWVGQWELNVASNAIEGFGSIREVAGPLIGGILLVGVALAVEKTLTFGSWLGKKWAPKWFSKMLMERKKAKKGGGKKESGKKGKKGKKK